MAKNMGYTIRKRGNSWQANLSRKFTGNDRIQITRSTKVEAEAEAERKLRDIEASAGKCIELSKAEWEACGVAVATLKERGFSGATVVDAVKTYVENNDPNRRKRKVADVVQGFLLARTGSGAKDITVKGYAWKFSRFNKAFGDRFIDEIIPSEIETWLNDNAITGGNRADYRRRLSILFRYAVANGYTKNNTGGAVAKVTRQKPKAEILTEQEIRVLLFTAKGYNLGRMVPFFALGAFCGLRPWEIRRTSWSNVNMDKRHVYVTTEACKTKEDRIVDIPDCCIEWLKLTPPELRTGPVFWTRNHFGAVIRKAGLTDRWQPDILRHSAASHLYAQTENSTKVTAQMGHSLSVFMTYYKATVEREQGEAYFSILPTGKASNVIELQKATGTL